MKKTSLYLRESEIERLKELSRRTGRTQADLVREAIAVYEPGPPDRDFAIFTHGAEGPGDSVADHDEEELLEGLGE
jgi:hypothetical protein